MPEFTSVPGSGQPQISTTGAPAAAQPAASAPAGITRLFDNLVPAVDPVEAEEARILAEEMRQSDAETFAGPETIAGYNFGQPPRGVEYSQEQDLAIRALFHAEGIPAPLGNEIGRLWNQAAANPPNEVQMEFGRQQCSLALERVWGLDMDARLKVAQAEVQRMAVRDPRIIGMLEKSGLGNNPWLVQTLYNLAVGKGRAK